MEASSDELILEGSELHKYLQSLQNDIPDLYKPAVLGEIREEPKKTSYCKVLNNNTNNLVLTRIILGSSLLMEEDAFYLFRVSSVASDHNDSNLKKLKFGCAIGLTIFFGTGVIGLSPFDYRTLILMREILSLVGPVLYNDLQHLFNKRTLEELIFTLQEIMTLTRKIIRLIREEDSLLYAKNMLCSSGSSDRSSTKKNKFKTKLHELLIFSSHTATCLKSLVMSTKIYCLKLLDIHGGRMEERDCVALYTHEELGINKPTDFTDEDSRYLVLLEEWASLYSLIQSDFLCTLGVLLYLSTNISSRLFGTVSDYCKESRSVLNSLKRHYNFYFFPSLPSSENKKSCNLRHSRNYSFLRSVSKSLNGCLIDVRELEEYVEQNEDGSNKSLDNYVASCLSVTEKELTVLLDSIQQFKKPFARTSLKIQNALDSLKEAESQNDEEVTKIVVGYSDFSVKGPDEVFLGHSDNDNLNTDCTSSNSSFPEVCQPPPALLGELKLALVGKREEFQKREIDALKSVDDIEEYKSCMDSDIVLPQIEVVTGLQKAGISKGPKQTPYSPTKIDEVLNINNHSLTRNVALAASTISSNWNHMKNIDSFGDSSDESDD